MHGDDMKFGTSLMLVIIALIIINKIPSIWPIILLGIIIISNLNKKKKKSVKRKSTNKRKKQTLSFNRKNSAKKNTDLNSFTDFELNTNNYQNSNYQSKPINQTEKFLVDKKKLARLRQMKTLKSSNPNQLFALQASFMDDFTDDYNIDIPCKVYTPTYNNLNIYQLRSFFSWRTLVRNGIYKKTETSYVYLYIYELINKIGVKNDIDGLNKLIELWQNYREFDNSIDYYLTIWIKDYYLINKINIDYKLIEQEFPITTFNNSNLISEIMIGNYSDKLKFYDEISSYHILKSKIMDNKYSFVIEMIIPKIFENLDKYFSENNYSFNKVLFGEIKKNIWVPFINAIYYDNNLSSDLNIALNNYEKYYKVNKIYYKETFEFSQSSKCLMGYILKNIDITLRECLKVNGNLKVNINMLEPLVEDRQLYNFLLDKKIVDIINITIKKYLIEHKSEIKNIITNKNKQDIIIDANKFENIRASSNRVQEKLIVEEEPVLNLENMVEEKEEIIETSDNIFVNLVANLDTKETEFLKMIVNNNPKNDLVDFCKKNNVLYEIMLENINNKALEIIGDNLLEDYGNEIIIYAEYLDSIKENIGGM